MPDLNLDELERLCEAAQGGKWVAESDIMGDWWVTTHFDEGGKHTVARCPGWPALDSEKTGNFRFIAAARTALPQLLRRVRELEGELAWFKSELEERS